MKSYLMMEEIYTSHFWSTVLPPADLYEGRDRVSCSVGTAQSLALSKYLTNPRKNEDALDN